MEGDAPSHGLFLYGSHRLPRYCGSPLCLDNVVQRNTCATFGTALAAGAAGWERCALSSRLRGSTPDFLSGFTPIAFASPEAPTRQWDYFPIAGALYLTVSVMNIEVLDVVNVEMCSVVLGRSWLVYS